METTTPTTPGNTPTNPPQVQTNQLPPQPRHSNSLLIIVGIIALMVGIGAGMYYLGTQQNQTNQSSSQQTSFIPSTTPILFEPPITETQISTTPATLTWKTQKILIQEDTERTGKITVNMELKHPSDWTFTTTPLAENPNSMIKNCSTYSIKSPDQKATLTLQPICTGWVAKNSPWPKGGIIALQKNCNGNGGPRTCYRVRYLDPANTYSYVDAITDANRPLNKNTDQVGDALVIGYAAPNESTNDFFFVPVHLTFTSTGSNTEKTDYLSIADQIASSVILQK